MFYGRKRDHSNKRERRTDQHLLLARLRRAVRIGYSRL
jgi:hypothetical protein